MHNFTAYNPVKILFGEGQIANITKEIPHTKKVLVTYGGGSIKKNGVYEQVSSALAQHDWQAFGGIEPNPQYLTLMKAVELVKKEKIDFILAVGGGSVLDGSKFIAAAAFYQGEDAYDICRKGVPITKALPIGSVITLAATGSEMNCGAVISHAPQQEKFAFQSPLVFPQFSVLDPSTLFSLPKHQVANGIIDSFVHVMEQYLTYPVDTPLQDRFAEGILSTLIESKAKIFDTDEKELNAYANFMWSATWALNGYIAYGAQSDWATHLIGHELTALKGLDHGVTLALVLPRLMNHVKTLRTEKLLQYAKRVWNIDKGSQEERVQLAIQKTTTFFNQLGVQTDWENYDIDLPLLQSIQKRFEARGIEHIGMCPDILTRELFTLLQQPTH